MALTQKQVSELYVAIFNRASEGEGNKFWQTSQTGAAAANDMLKDDAAKAYFGTSLDSNQAFIEHIYSNTLNKTYAQDKAGIDFWVNALNSGMSRGEVVASLVAAVADYASSTDPVTKAAYDQFINRVDVSNYMANTVEKAPANYATSTKFATSGATGLVVTNSASTVTTAKTSVDTMKPVPGQTFTLTTGVDTLALTTGDDTVTGTVGTLNATDTIIDNSTTDKDTLTVSLNEQDVKATIKNIETVNVNWTSNADLNIDATNMTGNTFNLNATALAFTGNSKFTTVGTNNINAGSKITGTLTANSILDSKIDAGSATTVVVSDTLPAAVPTVGQKTKANIVINNDLTSLTNTTANQVEELTISATKDAKLTLEGATGAGSAGIADKLTVEGSKSITLTSLVTGKEIVNNLTAGTLTVKSTDTLGTALAPIDFSKINANLIEITAAADVVQVKDNQNLSFTSSTATDLDSIVAKAGLSNVTTNLSTSKSITALDVTGITNLNLEVTKDATIGLKTDDANNVVVKGAGNTTITTVAATTVASIDASALTGTLTYTNLNTATTGIIGSSTAKNTLNLSASTGSVTAITGSANDEVKLAASAGKLNVTTGAGDDKITVDGDLTGKVTIDMGAGTNDTLVLDKTNTTVNALVKADNSSEVTLSGVETIVVDIDDTVFNNVLLDGKAYTIKTTANTYGIVVNAYDKSGVATTASTDLSGLTLSNATGSAVADVTINGLTNAVNTIKGTSGKDKITAGTKADIIDLSKGGADEVTIAAGHSTWSSTSNNVDKIASFSTSGLAATADKLIFSVGTVTKATAAANVEAGTAVKGEAVATGTVLANIDANGLLTAGGTNAGKIDTLEEYLNLAKIAIDSGTATVGETLAFKFAGNTYVYDVSTINTGAVATFNVVELTGVTSAIGVNDASVTPLIADTILIG